MGPCSVSTRSQSKPTDAISSATSGSPKFRRLPKHAFPARNRCFTWLGVIGRQYSAGENRGGGGGRPPPPPPPPPRRGARPPRRRGCPPRWSEDYESRGAARGAPPSG